MNITPDKKVGIFTTFGNWDDAYSPCNVVKNQLLALLRHGYSPTLFVLDVFPESSANTLISIFDQYKEKVELRRVIPAVAFEPYHGIAQHRNVPNSIEKDVAKITPVLEDQFKDFDVILCHDIIFQDSFLPYNASLHKMIMPKKLQFFHWMHSGPSIRPSDLTPPVSYLYTLPPQSKLVYMNNYDIVRAAEMYGVFPKDVRIVHNPIDYTSFKWIHPVVSRLFDAYRINEADIVAVYPLSTTRMGAGGKQLNKAIKIMGFLKQLGKNVRYIIPNAHANGDNEKIAIAEMLLLGKSYGLNEEDIIFTSFLGKEYEGGIPHDAVMQLFQYSDLFLFPSVSENAPLILLEAALTKNLLVLNEDFTPMKDFVGPHALYFKFDSVTTVTNHPRGEDVYFNDVAKIINSHLESNTEYKSKREVRQKFNLDYIFKNQMEPLFFE